jgi:hypothetical protein
VTVYTAQVFAVGVILALTPRRVWRRLRRATLASPRREGKAVATRFVANLSWVVLLGFSMAGIAGSGYNPFLYFRF